MILILEGNGILKTAQTNLGFPMSCLLMDACNSELSHSSVLYADIAGSFAAV